MDSAPPTTEVWHAYYGDLVVVAAPGLPGFEETARQRERAHGPGTWTISQEAHVRSLRTMNEKGTAPVSAEDFRWCAWSELRLKGQG
jgi:hypothetical protein